MQDNRALLYQTLAPQRKTKKQELISASALTLKNCQEFFTSASTPRASLFGRFTCSVQFFVHHWFSRIVARLFCFSFYNWQAEEDGVMGGHTRRAKHSKSSSTVVCDSAASLEDWKQQIKVKGNIPVNQQRLTFTSQRLTKQPVALANFIPSRQWQIIVDASIEELCKDLRHWRAILHSKNTSAELLQPLVLKETDELASILHSRAANELRDVGVPCNVFFLSFNKWIPTLQSGIVEEHKNPRGLDLKIDEDFCQNIFLIELCGDLNGLCLPMPLSYEMNGSELTSKLFMVEQTAQYREEQKQRYRHLSTPALKESEADNTEGSIEANSLSSSLKNYILEFDQNCEFATFISKDNHHLRCIVLPVITISLAEARGGEEQSLLHLSRGDSKEAIAELTSSVLALSSTSAEGSRSTARNIIQEVPPFDTSENPARKATKKKKKKKAKKAVKEKGKLLTQSEEPGNKATTSEGQLFCITTELSQGKVATDDAARHSFCCNCEKPCDVAETLMKDEVQCVMTSDIEHEDSGVSCPISAEDLGLKEMEDYDLANQCSLLSDLPVGSDQKQIPWSGPSIHNIGSDHDNASAVLRGQETFTHGFVFDQCSQVRDSSEVQKDPLGISKNCETVKVDDASVQTDISVNCGTTAASGDISAVPSSDVYDLLGQGKVNSAQPSLSESAVSKNFKDSCDNMQRAETQNVLHNEIVADNMMTNVNVQNERWEHTGVHANLNRNGFWTHRAPEGQENLFYRSKMNHNTFRGDSRSSAPFWRHQKNDLHGTSRSWSRPRLSKPDDWPAERGFFPGSRQLRDIPAWEQLPNLRQPSTSTRVPNHWNNAHFNDSWSPGQSYSSFNMQQRKSGKSNKISQHYLDKRQVQSTSNDMASTNMKALTVSPPIPYVNSLPPSIEASNGDAGMGIQSKGEVAIAPCATVQATSATTENNHLSAEYEKSGLQSSKSQSLKSEVVEHVCNILEVVSALMKTLNVYEQSLSGKALCEFEKVAKAVAPVFKASMTLRCWEQTGCSCQNLVTGFSKSQNSRQVPDVSLSSLWQWYEEPSCYGLKVKLSASSERTENQLQAFFVPYLSAIQVFGWPKRKRMNGNKETVAAQGGRPFDSGFLNQPIFSILLPRPESNNDARTSAGRHMQAGVKQKALDSEVGTISSSQRHCHCDVELLYEFFEVEKPQQRKPLTDRIKELVSKDADAHVLNSTKMEDLHPSSWFAVAWYPIYKIPDETFRSAFLTYHCLSSLQADSSKLTQSSHCIEKHMNTITAPVVGLMSYNAQVKDWFSLTPSCDVNLSDLLQQYLAKLETAAASMARGTCNLSSSFKHADYTFFQSRGRTSIGIIKAFKLLVDLKGYMRPMKGRQHALQANALLGC